MVSRVSPLLGGPEQLNVATSLAESTASEADSPAGVGYTPAMASSSAENARFTRRVGLSSIGTLLSRIAGVVRESVFAGLFGAGFATDAFNVAFRIPNFLRDLFAESALSAAFVPTLVQSLRTGDRARTWRFAANMLNTLALATAVISLLGMALAPSIVRLIAMGFGAEPAKLALTATLTRIMFPFFFFVVLAAWAMGVLNACGSFFVPALAPTAFNLFSALVPALGFGFFQARGQNPILGMAWGVVVGAVAQFAIQLPVLFRHGFRYSAELDLRSPELGQVLRRWLPMVLGFATWQVNFLVNTFLLTFLPEGSVTWVSYAYRIQHLPAGLFGVAIGSVAIAEFAHGAAENQYSAIRERFRHSMALVSVLTLPAALLLLALAVPVTRLVYEHGRFTAGDTALTAQALALYCIGIWAAAATRNVAAGFYACGDTRTPAFVAVAVVVGNILMNVILMRVVGFRSFPLAASAMQTANFFVLFTILRRRAGGLAGRYLASLTVRVLLVAILAAAAAFGCAELLRRLIGTISLVQQLLQVGVAGLAGIGVYLSGAMIAGIGEVKAAMHDLLGRRRSVMPNSSPADRV